jgi:hypothetical protein
MVIRHSLFAAAALALASVAGPAAAADVVDGPFVWAAGTRPVVREVVARPRVTVVRREAAMVRQAAYGCGCLGLPWGGAYETYVDLPWGGLRASCAPVVRRVIRTKRVVLSRKG